MPSVEEVWSGLEKIAEETSPVKKESEEWKRKEKYKVSKCVKSSKTLFPTKHTLWKWCIYLLEISPRNEERFPTQNFICILRLMTPHIYPEGMKRFIGYIRRSHNEKDQSWLRSWSKNGLRKDHGRTLAYRFMVVRGWTGMKASTCVKLCLYVLNFPLTPKEGIFRLSFQLSQMCCWKHGEQWA